MILKFIKKTLYTQKLSARLLTELQVNFLRELKGIWNHHHQQINIVLQR